MKIFLFNNFKLLVFLSIINLISIHVSARTQIPLECSTLIECDLKPNDNDHLNGVQTCYNPYKKDILVRKGTWNKDLLEGEFLCNDDSGNPMIKAIYKEGKLHGKFQKYLSQFNNWGYEQYYKDGLREGLHKEQVKENLWSIRLFAMDKPNGWELLIDKDNKVITKRNCELNVDASHLNQHQKELECDKIQIADYNFLKNSKKELEVKSNLNSSKKNGPVKFYYKNGNIKFIDFYENGEKIKVQTFFEEGELQEEIKYSGNFKESIHAYYQNSKPKFIKKYSKIEKWKTGLDLTEFYDNGKISLTGRKIIDATDTQGYGNWDGDVKNYDSKGDLISVKNYNNGVAEGLWKEWKDDKYFEYLYQSGKKIQESEYEPKTKVIIKKTEFMKDGSVK